MFTVNDAYCDIEVISAIDKVAIFLFCLFCPFFFCVQLICHSWAQATWHIVYQRSFSDIINACASLVVRVHSGALWIDIESDASETLIQPSHS